MPLAYINIYAWVHKYTEIFLIAGIGCKYLVSTKHYNTTPYEMLVYNYKHVETMVKDNLYYFKSLKTRSMTAPNSQHSRIS